MKLLAFLFVFSLAAAEPELTKPLKELVVESSSQITLSGEVFNYRTVAGNLILKDNQGKEKASLFYTAYFLKDATKVRPITFCFNGGPGAASVWLNLGLLGPKRIMGEDLAFLAPPYSLTDNLETVLDLTDLVFIDPISTGFSELAAGQNPNQLYNVIEDVQQMSDFIKLFTSKYKRWDSPKYLAGESYGGMRAAKVGLKLQDEDGFYINGLIFISPALDLQTITQGTTNDLPYVLALPTYAAAAHFHKKIGADSVDRAERFVENQYLSALFMGGRLGKNDQQAIAKELSQLTSLSEETIIHEDLRIGPGFFMEELLRKEGKLLGRFDARYTGFDSKCSAFYCEYDPSLEAVFGAITASYNQYLVAELKWPELKQYKPLVPISLWNWGVCNNYASGIVELRKLFAQNPKLHLFVATGLYDLAVPYYATEHSLAQLNLSPAQQARIYYKRYPAGHMMYFNNDIRTSLRKELKDFFNR